MKSSRGGRREGRRCQTPRAVHYMMQQEQQQLWRHFKRVIWIIVLCTTVECDLVDGLGSAHGLIKSLKHDFDMNVEFQLRKLGIKHDDIGAGNSTRCYGDLGCLHLTQDWFGLSRPVNVLPQEREVVNTQFFLRTRDTPRNLRSELLLLSDPSSITDSTFLTERKTKIIIHGFIDTGFVPWMKELSDAFLSHGDFNVILVDWGGGSDAIYSQAAANTRLVGLEVAHLVQAIMSAFPGSSSTSDFHVVGHSLGSHAAGYAGEALLLHGHGLLGRISALDPAEPLFQSMPEFVRLDPGDAEFVDAIHTDAKSILMFGYGMAQPVGHVDFYPNGGSDQPGCSLLDLPVNLNSMLSDNADHTADTVGRHLVACSHTRAIQLYIESLRKGQECLMLGLECSTYEEFKMGLCFSCGSNNEHCALLGFRADEYKANIKKLKRENVKFYLDTGSDPVRFCQFHYLMQVNLAQPPEAEPWVQGFLKVSMHGTQGEVEDISLTELESVRLTHGSKKAFVVAFPQDLGEVNVIEVHWEYDHDLVPLDLTKVCVLLCSDHIFILNLTVKRIYTSPVVAQTGNSKKTLSGLARDSASVICGDTQNQQYVDISSGSSKLFYKAC